MGGFHGGHSSGSSGSSGGGFHGGHSSSSGSGNNSPRDSFVHFIDTVHYGNSHGNPMTLAGTIFIAIVMIGIGILAFLLIATPRHATATITRTNIVGSRYDRYEVYDFEYVVDDKTYYGSGDDDLNSDGTLNINVGEKYTVYLHLFRNDTYVFEDKTLIGFIFGGVFFVIGVVIAGSSIFIFIKHKRLLRETGDANNDGKVNEYDLQYVDEKNSGMSDGAYLGARDATRDNVYDELRREKPRKVCPYCGAFVDDEDLLCTKCGGTLSEYNK